MDLRLAARAREGLGGTTGGASSGRLAPNFFHGNAPQKLKLCPELDKMGEKTGTGEPRG